MVLQRKYWENENRPTPKSTDTVQTTVNNVKRFTFSAYNFAANSISGLEVFSCF